MKNFPVLLVGAGLLAVAAILKTVTIVGYDETIGVQSAQAAQVEPVMIIEDVKSSPADISARQLAKEELTKREAELSAREKALGEKQETLNAFKKQIDMKVSELQMIRDEIKTYRDSIITQQTEDTKKLSAMYAGMKAKDAAEILNGTPVAVIVQIIDGMTDNQATPVLAALDAKIAKEVTSRMIARSKGGSAPK